MTIMYDVATVLLGKVAEQIPDLATKRVCVYPGSQYPWDECECGSIAVFMTKMYNANGWPPSEIPDIGPCPPNYVALDYSVVVLRCAPGPKDNGRAPLCTVLDAAAQLVFNDMAAMRVGVSNAVNDLVDAHLILDYALRDHSLVGPQGLCVGSQYNVTIGVADVWREC